MARSSSLPQQSAGRAHPGRAVDGEAPQRRPPDQHGPGAERQRLQDVHAAADAAVHQDLQPVARRRDHLGERVERRGRAVELAAAVVRDDDARGAGLRGADRVVGPS